jgi:hypothetical protein
MSNSSLITHINFLVAMTELAYISSTELEMLTPLKEEMGGLFS